MYRHGVCTGTTTAMPLCPGAPLCIFTLMIMSPDSYRSISSASSLNFAFAGWALQMFPEESGDPGSSPSSAGGLSAAVQEEKGPTTLLMAAGCQVPSGPWASIEC